jgi:predicted Fe-S protein YdhL (DUF1289 family)
MPNDFTDEDRAFFRAIRDDIKRRPAFYAPGFEYLRRHFGERRQVLEALRIGTRRRKLLPMARLGAAFAALERRGIGPSGDSIGDIDLPCTIAVLCLTWLLTDPEGDEDPASAGFGSFQDVRRRVRWGTLDDEERRAAWVEMARKAWRAVSANDRPKGSRDEQRSPGPRDLEAHRKTHGASMLGSHRISQIFGLRKAENLRKRLERWRVDNPGEVGRGWMEVPDRRGNTPAHLYQVDAVFDVIQKCWDAERNDEAGGRG